MIEPPIVEQHGQITYYTWRRTEGSRVYVVIDDDVDSLSLGTGGVADQSAPPIIHGLLPLRRQVWQWRSTRAFGFFPMQPSMELNENELIPAILSWLETIGELESVAFFLDVFYGHGTENPIGDQLADLLPGQLIGKRWKPYICFLSKAGGEHKSSGSKAAQGWRTIPKGDLHAHGALPPEVINDLGINISDRSPDYSTQWIKKSEWNCLRRCARSACTRIYELHKDSEASPLNHVQWPHHLPFGGDPYPDAGNQGYIAERFNELRSELINKYPGVGQWPNHQWQGESDDSGVPGYCHPPIRALASFDSDARDLTASVELCLEAARVALGEGSIGMTQISLDGKRDQFSHDYLWFNVGPLLSGLELLATEFRQFKESLSENEKPRSDLGVLGAIRAFNCEMTWHFEECEALVQGGPHAGPGLRIEIAEFVIAKWPGGEPASKFSVLRRLCPLSESMGKRKKTNCWEPIRASGANIAFQNGVLIITVPARKSEMSSSKRVIWEVLE